MTGNEKKFGEVEKLLVDDQSIENNSTEQSLVSSNFTRESYIETVGKIQERYGLAKEEAERQVKEFEEKHLAAK